MTTWKSSLGWIWMSAFNIFFKGIYHDLEVKEKSEQSCSELRKWMISVKWTELWLTKKIDESVKWSEQ